MRLLLLLSTILLGFTIAYSQDTNFNTNSIQDNNFNAETIEFESITKNTFEHTPKVFSYREEIVKDNELLELSTPLYSEISENKTEIGQKEFVSAEINKTEFSEKLEYQDFRKPTLPKQSEPADKFHWKPAIVESLYFLGIQHSFRMIQKKTRQEIDGKFFPDWGRSVRNLGGWRDGDSFLTNYIAHPMQGAVTGRIFINNSDKSKRQQFGKSKEYWESRFKAMAWSAVWSTQFELGPLSEATIGNVGLYDNVGPNRMGWVDLVVTPTAGTGVLIGEDMIDKFILKKWLEKDSSLTRIKIYRTFFTPFQSFTNVLRWKPPWKRDNR